MQVNRDSVVENIICTQYFSWTAALVGGLVAFGLGFLLHVFADAIGMTLYTNDPTGATTLAIGGFIGAIIGAIATMFTAGYAAGYFAAPNCGKRNYGIAYGFVAWSIGLLLMGAFAVGVSNALVGKSPLQAPAQSATMQEVKNTTQTVTNKVHPATDAGDTEAEQNVRAVGLVSLAFFVILFIGAVSACFGACFGFHCWEKCSVKYNNNI